MTDRKAGVSRIWVPLLLATKLAAFYCNSYCLKRSSA